MTTLPALHIEEIHRAKLILAAKVASMMGRKLEEGDWSEVYCKVKNIPDTRWSNLHIDVDYRGLGIEFKMLRVTRLKRESIRAVCGTSLMHPAATRSIRIEDTNQPPNEVMFDVLTQYADLIEQRTKRVKGNSPDGSVDMRLGWLLWEDSLCEFLYFEEAMTRPSPSDYYAIWNERPASGVRKASKSLWIFEKESGVKRFSVTTSAGIKIQPYFDVPPPSDPNLVYLRVQSEPLGDDTIVLWVSTATAERLRLQLGSTDKSVVSNAIFKASTATGKNTISDAEESNLAVPIHVSKEAFDVMVEHWDAVSDEHRVQLLLGTLNSDLSPYNQKVAEKTQFYGRE